MRVFFSPDDYNSYIALLAVQASRHLLDIWAYCLMPNHVHLVVVPSTEEGLSRPLAEAHRRYALLVNDQHRWTGHLWQARFSSFPMDEPYLLGAIRYVLLNPVRAKLVATAADWPYSSAKAQILGKPDKLVKFKPLAERVPEWNKYLLGGDSFKESESIRHHSSIGRPLGSDRFITALEQQSGRRLRPHAVGRKAKEK